MISLRNYMIVQMSNFLSMGNKFRSRISSALYMPDNYNLKYMTVKHCYYRVMWYRYQEDYRMHLNLSLDLDMSKCPEFNKLYYLNSRHFRHYMFQTIIHMSHSQDMDR